MFTRGYMPNDVLAIPMCSFNVHSGWWYTYPSEKSWSSSVGMMKFPIDGKENMFQTTNQLLFCSIYAHVFQVMTLHSNDSIWVLGSAVPVLGGYITIVLRGPTCQLMPLLRYLFIVRNHSSITHRIHVWNIYQHLP